MAQAAHGWRLSRDATGQIFRRRGRVVAPDFGRACVATVKSAKKIGWTQENGERAELAKARREDAAQAVGRMASTA